MFEIDYTKWEYSETDLEIIEEFNGHIHSITDDSIWIIYVDLSGEEEEAEIKTSVFDKRFSDEKPWLVEGSYFRWRFMKNPNDPNKTLDEFVLYKRTLSREDISRAKKIAEKISKQIVWK